MKSTVTRPGFILQGVRHAGRELVELASTAFPVDADAHAPLRERVSVEITLPSPSLQPPWMSPP